MSFDWKHFYFFARRIVDPDDDLPTHDTVQLRDAGFRSAISRAYYAAFHRMASTLGIKPEDMEDVGSVHSMVWNRAEEDSRTNIQEAARVGKRLKKSRSRADYNSSAASLAHEARAALDDVKELYRLTK